MTRSLMLSPTRNLRYRSSKPRASADSKRNDTTAISQCCRIADHQKSERSDPASNTHAAFAAALAAAVGSSIRSGAQLPGKLLARAEQPEQQHGESATCASTAAMATSSEAIHVEASENVEDKVTESNGLAMGRAEMIRKDPESPRISLTSQTDTALRKSELLLAQLSAMGLFDSDVDENRNDWSMISHNDDELGENESGIDVADSEETVSNDISKDDTPLCPEAEDVSAGPVNDEVKILTATDTVEVPVALFEMYLESHKKYNDLLMSLPTKKAHCMVASPSSDTLCPEPFHESLDLDSSCDSSDAASSVGPASWISSASSSMGSSMFSPQVSHRSLLMEGGVATPHSPCGFSPRSSFQPQMPPSLGHHRFTGNGHKAMHIRHPVGRVPKSCSIEQTVTITNTLHYQY